MSAELNSLINSMPPVYDKAWKTTVEFYHTNALINFIEGFAGLVVFGICLVILYHIFVKKREYKFYDKKVSLYDALDYCNWSTKVYVSIFIASTVSIGVGLSGLVIFLCNILSVWNWIALAHPQLYAVHELLRK